MFATSLDYAGCVHSANSPAFGAKALALSATANLARSLGQEALFERVNRPLMRLAEMQPVLDEMEIMAAPAAMLE